MYHANSAISNLPLQSRSATGLFAGINLGNIGQEVEDAAAVAPLVVVPADKLDEVLVQRDAGLSIEDRRGRVAVEVARDNLVLGVGENACSLLAHTTY
jgi:hypothetical protein